MAQLLNHVVIKVLIHHLDKGWLQNSPCFYSRVEVFCDAHLRVELDLNKTFIVDSFWLQTFLDCSIQVRLSLNAIHKFRVIVFTCQLYLVETHINFCYHLLQVVEALVGDTEAALNVKVVKVSVLPQREDKLIETFVCKVIISNS
jgi:hypothetical protein